MRLTCRSNLSLRDRVFCGCTSTGSKGIYTTMESFILLFFTPTYHSSLVTLRVTTILCSLYCTLFKDTATLLHLQMPHKRDWLLKIQVSPLSSGINELVRLVMINKLKMLLQNYLKTVLKERFDLMWTIVVASLVPVKAKCFTWPPLVELVTNCWLWNNTTYYENDHNIPRINLKRDSPLLQILWDMSWQGGLSAGEVICDARSIFPRHLCRWEEA